MKPLYLFFALAWVLYPSEGYAQRLSFSGTDLLWGNVTEATTNLRRSITLSNGTAQALRIDSVKVFTMYGTSAGAAGKPFGTSFMAGVDVPSGGSFPVELVLAPRHNIAHRSTALVCGAGIPGCRAIDLEASVSYRKGYYASTQNLWGQALFTALRTRITQGNNLLSYNTARDRMFLNIDNKRVNGQGTTANTTECIYTGRETTNYTTRNDAQNDNFNTEHTFPQGFFGGTATGPGTDIHHLFPTDETANGRRANFPFDTVTTTPTYTAGGSKLGTNNGRTVFEPRVQQKGKTARAMCYFVVRHQDYANFFAPQEAILRKWTTNYLPDSVELQRNKDVEIYQGNRNPFIDYPQLLDRIPSLANSTTAFPTMSKAALYPASATLAADDTNGYYFTLVNEGNQNLQTPTVAPPAGFRIVWAAAGNELEVGKARTFRLVPNGVQPGAYTYTPFTGTQISLTITGPNATNPTIGGIPLSIVPNPASGFVTIRYAGQITVFNAWGRPQYQGIAGLINLSGWSPGMYLVQAGNQRRRLVVL